MRKIKALIFDFDGTLVDSELFHYESWNMVLADFELRIDEGYYFKHFAGVPANENARIAVDQFNLPITPEQLLKRGEVLTAERLKTHQVQMMPFARETVEYFFDQGVPLAIVTGSPRHDVMATMDKIDLHRYFQHIVTRDDVINSKPDPESYSKCVDLMGFNPSEYLVFEDTKTGVSSAKGAGLTCLAVQRSKEEQTQLLQADQVFNDMQEAREFVVDNFEF